MLNLPAPVDIADWLQGTRDEHGRLKLSSRRLLVILEKLPDESEFKTWAQRAGDWTEAMMIAAETHKEIALNRASKYVGSENEYVPMIFIPPSERVAAARENAEELEAAMDLEALLSGAIDL